MPPRDPHIDKLINDLKAKKFREGEGKKLTETYGEEISKQLKPLFEAHSKEMSDKTSGALIKAIEGLQVNVPETKVPPVEVQYPEWQQPTFNVPESKVHVEIADIPAPVVNIPETVVNFPARMAAILEGIDRKNPLPVQMVDMKGNPWYPHFNGGESGPRPVSDILDGQGHSVIDRSTPGTPAVRVSGTLTVTGSNSSVNIIDSSGNVQGSAANPINVAIASGAASSTKAQIGNSDGDYSVANPLPVIFSASSTSAVNVVDSTGVAYSGSNPVPITGTVSISSAIGQGDSATALRIIQAGDSVSSTNVVTFNGNTPATGLNETTAGVLRVVQMTDSVTSVNIVSSVTQNIATVAVGLNETTAGVLRVAQMTDVTTSANITTFNGNAPATGLNETTNGVLRMVQMTDATSSVNITNSTIGVNMIGGGNDSVFTYQARTTLPTAVADGADVRPKADKLGRPLIRINQIRDLLKTSYTQVLTQAEIALTTGATTEFNDVIMLTATNASAAAWRVDIRATLGGNVVHTMNVPAGVGPVGWTPSVPFPQSDVNASWTATIASGSDVSNSNLFITGLYSRET